MAVILPFHRRHSGTRTSRAQAKGEVVFFPGVRVEYHEREREPQAPPRQPAHNGVAAENTPLSA